MSNRLTRWDSSIRSKTHSLTTIGRKLYEAASNTVARTQLEVAPPAMSSVSTPRSISMESSGVPKKALGLCFSMTGSPGRGATRGLMAAPGVPASSQLGPASRSRLSA